MIIKARGRNGRWDSTAHAVIDPGLPGAVSRAPVALLPYSGGAATTAPSCVCRLRRHR